MNIKNAKLVPMEFEHEPWEVPCIIIEATSKPHALKILAESTKDLAALFEENPHLDEEEPWFGWAFKIGSEIISESELMEECAKDKNNHAHMAAYVENVRRYFAATDAEPGFYVHEEKEAGADAALHLMLSDPSAHLDLYLSYLRAMDFEHTVALTDHISILKDELDEAQWAKASVELAAIEGTAEALAR